MCNKWTWGRTVTRDDGGKKSRMKATCCPSLGQSNIRDYDTAVLAKWISLALRAFIKGQSE